MEELNPKLVRDNTDSINELFDKVNQLSEHISHLDKVYAEVTDSIYDSIDHLTTRIDELEAVKCEKLTEREKQLLAEIKKGTADTVTLAKLFGISKPRISQLKSQLKEKGFIKPGFIERKSGQ